MPAPEQPSAEQLATVMLERVLAVLPTMHSSSDAEIRCTLSRIYEALTVAGVRVQESMRNVGQVRGDAMRTESHLAEVRRLYQTHPGLANIRRANPQSDYQAAQNRIPTPDYARATLHNMDRERRAEQARRLSDIANAVQGIGSTLGASLAAFGAANPPSRPVDPEQTAFVDVEPPDA